MRRTPERTPTLGRNAFRDMKTLTKAGQSPVVFDVGAHAGATVAEFCRTFASATVHSFEPNPEVFAELVAGVGSLPNVIANNIGLGSKTGSSIFVDNKSADMSSFLPPGPDSWGEVLGRRALPISTLDEYCAARGVHCVDILKSDTQGYELEVLKGAAQAFARNQVHMVYVELIFNEMYEGMPRFDEVCRSLLDDRFRLVSIYDVYYQNGRASWTDALFINPDFNR
jgi:FkbM family methyltransferase